MNYQSSKTRPAKLMQSNTKRWVSGASRIVYMWALQVSQCGGSGENRTVAPVTTVVQNLGAQFFWLPSPTPMALPTVELFSFLWMCSSSKPLPGRVDQYSFFAILTLLFFVLPSLGGLWETVVGLSVPPTRVLSPWHWRFCLVHFLIPKA